MFPVFHVCSTPRHSRTRAVSVLRKSVLSNFFSAVCFPAEFGGDHDIVAKRSESFADEFLVRERSVHWRGVKGRNAAFGRGTEERDDLLLVFRGPIGSAHSHAAEADGGNFQTAISQFGVSASVCGLR
jgi:hypothetical protein